MSSQKLKFRTQIEEILGMLLIDSELDRMLLPLLLVIDNKFLYSSNVIILHQLRIPDIRY